MATRNPTVEETLGDIRSSLDRLQNDLLRQARAAGQTLAAEAPKLANGAANVGSALYAEGAEQANGLLKTGRRLWSAAGERIGHAGESVHGAVDRARDTVTDAAGVAGQTTRRGLVTTRRFVRSRPVASLAIALAAGMLIGRALDVTRE